MSRFSVRVYPNAPKDEILGLDENGRLKIRVCAPPTKGEANKRLLKLLAEELKISKSRLSILSGEKSRDKLLEIKGTTKPITELLKK